MSAPKPSIVRHVESREKISVSEQFMRDLLPMIRRQFMPEVTDKYWHTHAWLVRRAITYPAAWLNGKGVFVSTARYRQIVLDLLQDIKRHAGAMDLAPAYLLVSVQRHFKHQGERYYEEGKAARDLVGRVVGQLKQGQARPDELVRTLAEAHRLLKPARRQRAAATIEPGLFPDL